MRPILGPLTFIALLAIAACSRPSDLRDAARRQPPSRTPSNVALSESPPGTQPTATPTSVTATTLMDTRQSFPEIQPYTSPATPPYVSPEFTVPGPGRIIVTEVIDPWIRSSDGGAQFRSLVPVDGRDEGAWTGHFPGAAYVTGSSTPERWVEGAPITRVSELGTTQARPRIQVALFPNTVHYGDGSISQVASTVHVTVTFTAAP